MNGQQRDSGQSKKDQERIFLEKIETVENYRGYKKILMIRPYSNTYLGYLDNNFFGFMIKENDIKYWMMDAKKAVDYYLDKTFFHNPVLEYDTFIAIPNYAPSIRFLQMVKDNDNKH